MGFIQKIRESRAFQRVMRVLQFLSAIISLGLFTARLVKIARLVNQGLSTSNGAVEGILAAAVLYTLILMILRFLLKRGAPTILRWVMIVMDLLFMIAFIVVAVLTRPNGGSSGPCRNSRYQRLIPSGQNCNLPWGTFILGIVSTILHFLTALFHEAKDHHNRVKNVHDDRYAHEDRSAHNGRSEMANGHEFR